MKSCKFYFEPIIILTLFALLIFGSCNKEEDLPADTGTIKIQSLTATDTVLKAWTDSAYIEVMASGDNLQYKWSANHGTLYGNGTKVGYTAGECCVGLNTITCSVFNDSCSVSRNINIRITSYFGQ